MIAVDQLYTTVRTSPGAPGWLPHIPRPPEWPPLSDRVTKLIRKCKGDHDHAELVINQEFAEGQWQMAYLCKPQPFDNSLMGPLPNQIERTINLPPHPLYGCVIDWAASKLHVVVYSDGIFEVIRRDTRVLKATLPTLAGRWSFFARRTPLSVWTPPAPPLSKEEQAGRIIEQLYKCPPHDLPSGFTTGSVTTAVNAELERRAKLKGLKEYDTVSEETVNRALGRDKQRPPKRK